MPQFVSNIKILPEDRMKEAFATIAEGSMRMDQLKMEDRLRREAKMEELATANLGNVFSADNAQLQKEYQGFIDKVTKTYGTYSGRVPWEEQAKLRGEKQNLLQKAAVSEEHRKEYVEAMKRAVTDPDIDEEATLTALRDWSKTPLDNRPSAWNVIVPKMDLTKYFKDHVIVNEDVNMYGPKAGKIYKDTKFDSLPQMLNIYGEEKLVRNKVNSMMLKSGIKPENGAYTTDQVSKFLKDNYAPLFDVDKQEFSYRQSGSNVYIGNGGVMTPTSGAGNTKKFYSFITPQGTRIPKGGQPQAVEMNVSFGENMAPVNDADVTFQGTSYMNLSGYDLPKTPATSIRMKVQGVREVPVVWNKERKEWLLASDEWREKHPDQEANVKMKKYIIGVNDVVTTVGDKQVTRQRDLLIPATAANMATLKNGLTKEERKAWGVGADDFSGGDNGSYPDDMVLVYGGKEYTYGDLKKKNSEEMIQSYIAAGKMTKKSK